MVQAKFFPHLPAGKRWAPLLQARLREITVLEVLEVALDELASIIGLRAPRALSQFRQSPLGIRVEPNRKHRNLLVLHVIYIIHL
jgi:hypothetical protein